MKHASFLLFALLSLTASGALAHEIARDGNVGALMHTDPDDAPLVGTPTGVYFELNLKGGRSIPLAQCSCTLSVYAGSRTTLPALSHGVLRQSKGELQSSVVFPTPGAYTLVLAGRPKTGTSFPPFKLSWTVRADTTGGGTPMKH